MACRGRNAKSHSKSRLIRNGHKLHQDPSHPTGAFSEHMWRGKQSTDRAPKLKACGGPTQSATWSPSCPLGTWVTSSVDWDWIRYFAFLVYDLSLIKSWPIKILPGHLSLKVTQGATSPALVPTTEIIDYKNPPWSESWVLEVILGGNPTGRLPSHLQVTLN